MPTVCLMRMLDILYFGFLNPEDGIERLCQNVGKKLPLLASSSSSFSSSSGGGGIVVVVVVVVVAVVVGVVVV